MQNFPKKKCIMDYVNILTLSFIYMHDTHATKPQPLYCGEKCPSQPVYAIITSSSLIITIGGFA